MSLMGWSTTDMATRYQHVTDEIRAEVASQLDGLIWEAHADEAENTTVTVQRESLAAILPLVEDGLLTHDRRDEIDVAGLTAALADLRTALSEPDDSTAGDTK